MLFLSIRNLVMHINPQSYCTPPSGFPKIALRTLRNPIYLLVVLALVNLSALLSGLATFMAKFIEKQFSQSASFSTMMIGERTWIVPWKSLQRNQAVDIKMKLLFSELLISRRRSRDPNGGTGDRPGWSSDATVQSFSQWRQQIVHNSHPSLHSDCPTNAVPRLSHTEHCWGL